ncbi:MAG TPA: 50S ribosomal protein L4 [Candidatus Woesebacteria bacterium]|nr:50S ribosomal protein L4 [Candidatus Woesebacteria bacterium]
MATKKVTTTSQSDLSVFSLEVSPKLLAQAIYVYQENSHAGTSKVKTRGEINLTKHKAYKQKGTGNARHGAKSAPIFVGGGIVFGPQGLKLAPKSLNKKMKIKALMGILSLYQKENRLSLLDASLIKASSAKSASKVLGNDKLGLVHFKEDAGFTKSVGNLDNVVLLSASRLNAYKVATCPKIVITPAAYTILVERLKSVISTQTK